MAIFRQGDTTNVDIELWKPLDGKKMKLGLYRSGGAPLYETVYPDDGKIQKIDECHYILKIGYEEAMSLVGTLTLRVTVYSEDLSMVNSGENVMTLTWEKEPVNKNLT